MHGLINVSDIFVPNILHLDIHIHHDRSIGVPNIHHTKHGIPKVCFFVAAQDHALCTKSKISIYLRVKKNKRRREFVQGSIESLATEIKPLVIY